ncbi:unnamed protein product [Phytophthora fragariaefolia]|uniref:Unnamed protein product n=1 Tax=Phytophthora fragariaefolia TaxID=1490495 RepID=A0A9W6XER6_9STRA|nr:unnamed protein product [Phytophthora fragariaefolia]
MHPPVKESLCSLEFWDIVENGLSTTATEEAACDFVDLLDALLRDPATYQTLARMLSNTGHQLEAQSVTKPRVEALKGQVEALQHSHIYNQDNVARIVFIATQLQSLIDETSAEVDSTPMGDGSVGFGGYEPFRYHRPGQSQGSTHSEEDSGDELPVDSGGSFCYGNDPRAGDANDLLLGKGSGYFEKFLQQAQRTQANLNPSAKDTVTIHEINNADQLNVLCKAPYEANICAKIHSNLSTQQPGSKLNGAHEIAVEKWNALCEENIREAQNIQIARHQTTADKETEKWRSLYEASTREVERVQHSFQDLNERYQIVLRRSKEQTKILALQNLRISSHGNEYQQILRRMRTLEKSLEEADRRCKVEQALRSAEAVQSEQLSLALNQSAREMKNLAAQQSSTARELQEKENLRTEYMMRTRESKQDKQRVEVERDNALIKIEILIQEKVSGWRESY